MSKSDVAEKQARVERRPILITFLGVVVMIALILATIDVSNRGISTFISTQKRYIVAIESTVLVAFIVEMLVRLAAWLSPQMLEHGARLRLIVRIVGYSVGSLSVIAILSSNAALGISVGAIAGVVIAFATQNVLASVLAAILLLGTRMVKVGEEISVAQTKGIVSDINLTHTVLSVDEDVVFVPNSLVISSIVRRKKRDSRRGAGVNDW